MEFVGIEILENNRFRYLKIIIHVCMDLSRIKLLAQTVVSK